MAHDGSRYAYASIGDCQEQVPTGRGGGGAARPPSSQSPSPPRDAARALLLLPAGDGDEDEDDDDYADEPHYAREARRQRRYVRRHRLAVLGLVALTPTGVKFFKAAQSSFEEYLMHDPRILMSATTYSLMLSLMSLPVATLAGGALLDCKADRGRGRCGGRGDAVRARTPSYSAVLFLVLSLLGIALYGYGLEYANSVPWGLAGASLFGLAEGCVVVASRTFASHLFYGADGAFAQGVLVATNSLAMMASKVSLPWLIENGQGIRAQLAEELRRENRPALFDDDTFAFDYAANPSSRRELDSAEGNSIWIGVLACCAVQLVSVAAGVLYAAWFGLAPPPESRHVTTRGPPQAPGQASAETSEEAPVPAKQRKSSARQTCALFAEGCFRRLPPTFWIVAVGRGLFIVVFKVFTRNSNSFLMEKFGASAIAAGRKSSLHELFSLGSPIVGLLAYRSPGGIVPVLLGAALLASASIAALAGLPAEDVRAYLPGGALAPIVGISVAHGVFVPVCMAIIPQTCAPEQLGMAFAVVEVLGSVFNLTNILFGWLRDATGSYEVPMQMLLLYTLVGTCLLYMSRNNIKLKLPNEE